MSESTEIRNRKSQRSSGNESSSLSSLSDQEDSGLSTTRTNDYEVNNNSENNYHGNGNRNDNDNPMNSLAATKRRQSLYRQNHIELSSSTNKCPSLDEQDKMDNKKKLRARHSTSSSLPYRFVKTFSRYLLYSFGIILAIYLISPIVFRYCTFIQRSLLFMNFVNLPLYLNLSHPELIGLKCTRAILLENTNIPLGSILESERKNTISGKDKFLTYGVWHILPGSSLERCYSIKNENRTTISDDQAFNDDSHIIFYVHGNGGSRGGNHRRELYKMLAYDNNYHVLTFDYRGYADSSNVAVSAPGLNEDTKFIYQWLLAHPHVHPKRITVWGHSLGAAVATRAIAELMTSSKNAPSIGPSSLILEAPFDTIANAIGGHPFSRPFHLIPYFEYFFIDPLMNSEEFHFDSVTRIKLIKNIPILIMHAKDDRIIPYELGYQLYQAARETHGEKFVEFVSAESKLKLGHKHMCRHRPIMERVINFINSNIKSPPPSPAQNSRLKSNTHV